MSPDIQMHIEAIERALPENGVEDLLCILGDLERLKAAAWLLTTQHDTSPKVKPEPDENLSIEEAARRLGVSRAWLYKHASRLPFTVRIGRRLLFTAHGLERWNRQRQGR